MEGSLSTVRYANVLGTLVGFRRIMMASPSLSADSVHETIDNFLASTTPRSAGNKDVVLRRMTTEEDWNSATTSVLDSETRTEGDGAEFRKKTNNQLASFGRPPFYFGIQALKKDPSKPETSLVGFCTFYIAYSTLDGRMLYADQIKAETDGSLLLYLVMAKIATEIGCTEFRWKQKERPQWNIAVANPTYLHDWVFWSMDRLAMSNFVGSPPTASRADSNIEEVKVTKAQPLHRRYVEEAITETLAQQTKSTNNSSNTTVKLRLAGPDDTETIARIVQQLAIYEKEADAVNMTAKGYLLDGYSPSTEPLFYCILADVATATIDVGRVGKAVDPMTQTTAAMGLFYFGNDLVDGAFLYLLNLFCDEAHRGKGVGTTIMKQLARISLALDCSQFVWTALDWNAPAISFYKKIGATAKDDAKPTRYQGEHLRSFAHLA